LLYLTSNNTSLFINFIYSVFLIIFVLIFLYFSFCLYNFILGIFAQTIHYVDSYWLPILTCEVYHSTQRFGVKWPVRRLYSVCQSYWLAETCTCCCLLIMLDSKTTRWVTKYLCLCSDYFCKFSYVIECVRIQYPRSITKRISPCWMPMNV